MIQHRSQEAHPIALHLQNVGLVPVRDAEHGFADGVHRARLLLNFACQVQCCTRDDLQRAEKVRGARVYACGQEVHDIAFKCFKAVLLF